MFWIAYYFVYIYIFSTVIFNFILILFLYSIFSNSYIRLTKLLSCCIVHTTSCFKVFNKLWILALTWLLTLFSPITKKPIIIKSSSQIFSLHFKFRCYKKYLTYIVIFSSFNKNIFSFRRKGELWISFLTAFVLLSTNWNEITASWFGFFFKYASDLPNLPLFTITW